MKLSVSSYSFYGAVQSGAVKSDGLIEKAKEMGFEGIEFAGLGTPAGMNAKDYAKQLCERSKELGIEITCYSVGGNFLCDDPKAEAERLKNEVDIASLLGTKYMRHDMCFAPYALGKGYRSFERNLPILIEGAKTVTEYAKEHGIKTMVENHGMFCQDSHRIEMLVDGVNSDNYGALVDIGNFLCVDEDPGKAVGVLRNYAFSMHCKDFYYRDGNTPPENDGWIFTRGGNYIKGAVLGDGIVPIEKCIRILKKAGFDGNITIEYEGLEDCLNALTKGKKFLEKAVSHC